MRGPVRYLPQSELLSFWDELSSIVTEPPRAPDLVFVRQHVRALEEACKWAPTAIIAGRIDTHAEDEVFVNVEATRLLGMSAAEIKRRYASEQCFWMDVWAASEWARMCSECFNCMVRQQETFSTRTWLRNTSGTPLDRCCACVRRGCLT